MMSLKYDENFINNVSRSINEVSHFLDDQRGRSLACKDLFTVTVDTQRIKLKNYCERMMLADPVCYGRKAEDIMWRKTYHDVYSTAKILRKVMKKINLYLVYYRYISMCHCPFY